MSATDPPAATPADGQGGDGTNRATVAHSSFTTTAVAATVPNPNPSSSNPSLRSGSIILQQPITSCSHVNVCRPWISWKKGNISEYVSKPRVFFDHFHHQIVLFTGSPPNKMWRSDRKTQTWMDYPISLPPHNDIIGAQFSPDRSHVALRVSDKEVKVLSTATGEVVTARSCRGTSSRMISVHWINDPSLSKTKDPPALFLLFVTNAGVELYELTSEKEKSSSLIGSSGSGSSLTSSSAQPSATGSSSTAASSMIKNKLKHVKTATYNIVYHWILLDENILLLVNARNEFQAYKLSSKSITKLCKFELDCGGTSLNPPHLVSFHREQISLVWLYGRMVILFVNEQKGQLHLLSLTQPNTSSEEVEQSHVFDLFAPGKYDISNIDNVLVVHNTVTKLSMLFDVRSESKTTITEPLPIGPPLMKVGYVQGSAGAISGSSGSSVTASTSASAVNHSINYFDPASLLTSNPSSSAASPTDHTRSAPGMSSLAPATFHPYIKWTFLAPKYVWESTGDQQQGNLWTLQLNLQQIAFSWPNSKRTRLVDFLLKRTTVEAKILIFQILLQIICTESSSLALLSRLFSLLNRMNYDHRMNPNVPLTNTTGTTNLASLPLLPPFSNPPSAANTAPSSQVTSPAAVGNMQLGRNAALSVSPYKPSPTSSLFQASSPAAARMSMGGLSASASGSPMHRATMSGGGAAGIGSASSFTPPTTDGLSNFPGSSAITGAAGSIDLDDSLSVLSCEMLDIPAMLAQPVIVEHNLHGYMLISQLDIFLHVFTRAREVVPLKQLIPVVVEYLRSVHRHFLKPEDIVNDLLVSLLLQDGQHYELHQFLQYHILNDSLPIANRLIASAATYPPAYQLGIDMLYRLGAIPRLTKVLLQHGQVLAALKLLPNFKSPILETFGLQPRDFMQVAVNTKDDLIFYHTYKFFELRNQALRGHPGFVTGDGCDEFVQLFTEKFPTALAPIQQPNPALRGSIVADMRAKPPAAGGITSTTQYINIGDDDGDEEDDDDIEYFGEKPSIYATASTTSDSGNNTLETPPASSPDPASSASNNEPVRFPSPVDLSTTMNIPSATPSVGDGEEDAAAESGLGADTESSQQERDDPSSSPLPAVQVDGSFGGVSERADESNAHASSSGKSAPRKKKGGFQAEPAM